MNLRTQVSLICCILLFAVSTGCKRNNRVQAQQSTTNNANTNTSNTTTKPRPTTRQQKLSRKEVIKKAKEVTAAAFRSLAGRLRKAIEKGGVPNAISVCSKVAIPLTEKVGKQYNVTLARVSHKPRNPSNAANPTERQMIQRYIKQMKKDNPFQPIVVEGANTQTYYAPILLAMPLCLKCHGVVGKQISAKNYAVIRKNYPRDQAVNFQMGDVRGLWKVTFRY